MKKSEENVSIPPDILRQILDQRQTIGISSVSTGSYSELKEHHKTQSWLEKMLAGSSLCIITIFLLICLGSYIYYSMRDDKNISTFLGLLGTGIGFVGGFWTGSSKR